MKQKMSARDIVQQCNMSARSEFYSGRGATMGDLNHQILTDVAKLIEKHHGKQAKGNFVKMVAALPVASATDFLNQLYTLENRDWEFNEDTMEHANGIDVGDHETNIVPAMMTVMHAFAGGPERDDTHAIRDQFLMQNGVKPDRKDGDGYFCEGQDFYGNNRRMKW